MRSRWDRLAEKACLFVAWRLPRRLVMWCCIRVMAHATQGPWSNTVVPEITAMEVLKRWEVA